MLLTKKDTTGKTVQARGGQGGEGIKMSFNVPAPQEVWSTKKTSAMTELHEVGSVHADWEEEVTECPASLEI